MVKSERKKVIFFIVVGVLGERKHSEAKPTSRENRCAYESDRDGMSKQQ